MLPLTAFSANGKQGNQIQVYGHLHLDRFIYSGVTENKNTEIHSTVIKEKNRFLQNPPVFLLKLYL